MPSISDILTQNSNDKVEIKSQVNLNGESFKTFKQFIEQFGTYEVATIIESRNLSSETSIYGNTISATYGTSRYNTSYINSLETIRVIPPNRTFTDRFAGIAFVNLSSTATVSGDIVSFTSGEYLQSEIIYKNNETINSATLTSVEESGSFNYEMTADYKTPIGHWSFNSDYNDSAGNFTTTGTGSGVSRTSGKLNDAATFNGVSTECDIVLSDTGSVGSSVYDFSICCWFKPTEIDKSHTIMDFAFNYGNDNGFLFRPSSNNNYGIYYGNSLFTFTSYDFEGDLNNWKHITLVHNDSLQQDSLYVDGIFKETINTQSFVYGSGEYHIGEEHTSATKGQIDDIRLYNEILTQSEVQAIYNSDSGTEEENANWETVTSGTKHTFTNSGTDLRYKAEENNNSTGEISKIEVVV